ncbi:MAG: transposase [Clostridia bacterium]|nr:transposase [Clostridia bacterium]
MLKIVLYANMENIYSSRKIESACRRDINFIWLLNGASAPNYHEIGHIELPDRNPQDNYVADTRKGVSVRYI